MKVPMNSPRNTAISPRKVVWCFCVWMSDGCADDGSCMGKVCPLSDVAPVLPVMMDMRLRLLRVVIERRGWCRMRSIGERKRSSITGRKAAAGGKKSSAEKRKPGLVQRMVSLEHECGRVTALYAARQMAGVQQASIDSLLTHLGNRSPPMRKYVGFHAAGAKVEAILAKYARIIG
jgi:hypothetical protein